MKVSELIEELLKHPQDLEVGLLYDGEVRLSVDVAFVSKSNDVVLTGLDEVIYSDESRPVNSPTQKDVPYFYTAKGGN